MIRLLQGVHWAILPILCLLAVVGSLAVARQEKSDLPVVTAEGIGKDAKEARKAAFRDAVGKVVGTLVDAETLVKNDEVISERVLEFSGGFIKTYDTLKTETLPSGLVRVRIKATVERLQIVSKLQDVKVAVKEVKGTDLLAEKMTKEEARKNATELLAKLFEEMPKVVTTKVVGKPVLADTEDSVTVTALVQVDMKAYGEFVKKATNLLDKMAITKDSVLLTAEFRRQENHFSLYREKRVFHLPDLHKIDVPRGYAVWIMTFIDQSGTKTRWNFYWVDADLKKSISPLTGEKQLHIKLVDKAGELVSEDEGPLIDLRDLQWNYQPHWFLWKCFPRRYSREGEIRETASLFIAPLCTLINADEVGSQSQAYTLGVSVKRKIKLTNAELEKVKEVRTSLELRR